ncbi:hypothetical protein Fot_16928 [Forsythia ovata]|uniref:Uncharacterized protein n=1 Tax=Forsythia ovata TaxID=205694 RepID=A0ABD1VE84_9LAMI
MKRKAHRKLDDKSTPSISSLKKKTGTKGKKNPNLTSACSTNQIDPIEDGSKSPGFAAAPTLALEIDRKYPDLSALEQRTVQKTRAKRKIKQKERKSKHASKTRA